MLKLLTMQWFRLSFPSRQACHSSEERAGKKGSQRVCQPPTVTIDAESGGEWVDPPKLLGNVEVQRRSRLQVRFFHCEICTGMPDGATEDSGKMLAEESACQVVPDAGGACRRGSFGCLCN